MSVRPNVKLQNSNRELHEAMGLKPYYTGRAIHPDTIFLLCVWLCVFIGCALYYTFS